MNLPTADLVQYALAWYQKVTWVDVGELLFVLMSIIGQEYIARRNKAGFGFWLVGNVVAVFVFGSSGRLVSACLYAYFAFKSFAGLRHWGRLDALERSEARARPQPALPAVARGATGA
ncbi:nicotinamide mononucleotide transporter [Ramlibacter sp. AN1133]|uniref:nicotinamide mononucleotide transporter n=1 Tax=Ramlibacter sp. AN1133 TaxID=3133429 RepID=UPI0030BEDE70